ncbi:hypothetical protein Fmac_032640 [Flemingia macrophylla]|uniref:Uncharacterized protein n=1 Tax=Flemingia macrophylla TaxID=520843 RepID=A0ABD1L5J4_9FABA
MGLRGCIAHSPKVAMRQLMRAQTIPSQEELGGLCLFRESVNLEEIHAICKAWEKPVYMGDRELGKARASVYVDYEEWRKRRGVPQPSTSLAPASADSKLQDKVDALTKKLEIMGAQKWWEVAHKRSTSLSEFRENEKKGLAQIGRLCEERDRAIDKANELKALISFYKEKAKEAQANCDNMSHAVHQQAEALARHHCIQDMWGEIIGADDFHPGIKGSRLADPLRICHKLLTETVHGRYKSPKSITKSDLLALYCIQARWKANQGYFFIKHVQVIGTRKRGDARQGHIVVMSLISHLAELWGCPDGIEADALAPKPIDPTTLVNMKMIMRVGDRYVKNLGATVEEMMNDLEFQVPLAGFQQQQAPAVDWQQQLRDIQTYNEVQFQDAIFAWMQARFPSPSQDPPADD